ncbi:MAG: hypothetical protein R2713_07155 [Ilumatobacteraceae bacterium]
MFTPEGTDVMIDRLDDLVDLGITAVEVMPLATFPGERGWGYDGVLLLTPCTSPTADPMRSAASSTRHARHLAVVLDVVYNHTSTVRQPPAETRPLLHQRPLDTVGRRRNLDQPGSDEVRRFFVDTAMMWIRDFHVDGPRPGRGPRCPRRPAASGREPFLAQPTRAVRRRRRRTRRVRDQRERPQRPDPGRPGP